MQKSGPNLLYAFASALLLGLAWYFQLGILIFFGFVPLLLLEERLRPYSFGSYLKLFGFVYLAFLCWNLIVTWWITYASLGGAIMAFVCNALLMALVFVIYSLFKRSINTKWATWLLIPLWLAFEYIHTLWDITWTWLSLGNVFAFHHNWVQWFSITGVSGGSAWILAVNIFAFTLIKENKIRSLFSKQVGMLFAAVLLPILISYAMLLSKPSAKNEGVEVLVVQPNIDPYNEKFNTSYESQLVKTIALIRKKITPQTAYLVLPETFITGYVNDLNEDGINELPEIKWFRDSLILKYPQLSVVTGASTYKYYSLLEKPSLSARKDSRNYLYYDMYNTALYINLDSTIIYHKSKLVPGVEKMPFPYIFKLFEGLAIDMGGTVGSLGTQSTRTVFKDRDRNIGIAPVICYESVYGDFVSEYVRNGANLIFIVTNDGWWDDTPGYKQHLQYARLRAIENRRCIARSANTGVSCFIDEYGNISQATPYWQSAVISQNIQPNNTITFFSRFGDVLSYLSIIVCLLLPFTLVFFRGAKLPVNTTTQS